MIPESEDFLPKLWLWRGKSLVCLGFFCSRLGGRCEDLGFTPGDVPAVLFSL